MQNFQAVFGWFLRKSYLCDSFYRTAFTELILKKLKPILDRFTDN